MSCALEDLISCLVEVTQRTHGSQPAGLVADLVDPRKILCCLRPLSKQGRSLQVVGFT